MKTFLILLGGEVLGGLRGSLQEAQAVVDRYAHPEAFTIVAANDYSPSAQSSSREKLAAFAKGQNILSTDQN